MLNLLDSKKAAAVSVANGAGVSQETPSGVIRVPLVKLMDNPYQPRTHYDAEHILNLALSIKGLKDELPATLGLQQLPMARVGMTQRDGSFILADRNMYVTGMVSRVLDKRDAMAQLMFGHSRLRAFMVLSEGLRSLRDGAAIGMSFAGVSELETRFADLLDADLDYSEMPIHLGFALDHAMWSHAITENSQRKNITAIEEAVSIQRAMEEFGLNTAEAGKPFGYARSTTANKLRLLQLPDEMIRAIAAGDMTERHGRELLRLVDHPERMKRAFDWSMVRGHTVAQLVNEVEYQLGMIEAEQKKTERQPVAPLVVEEVTPPPPVEEKPEARSQKADGSDRQVETLNRQSAALWGQWVEAQDWEALWMDLRFWREVAKNNGKLPDIIMNAVDVQDTCQELLRLLYKRTRRYDSGLQSEVHYPHEVRELIERLGGEGSTTP